MAQMYPRRRSGALNLQTRLAVPRRRDQWNVAKLSEANWRTRLAERVVPRDNHVQRFSTQVDTFDGARHDISGDDAEIGKGSPPGPNWIAVFTRPQSARADFSLQ
jgi:hypothetical protein